jgi:hypothetical protein
MRLFPARLIAYFVTLSVRRFGLCPSGSFCARGTIVPVTSSSIAGTIDCGWGAFEEFDIATVKQYERKICEAII